MKESYDKMDYFITRADERFDKLELKVDKLLEFKWQIIGGSVVVSTLVSLALSLFLRK